MKRTCIKCGKTYPATKKHFYVDSHTKYLRSECKSCHSKATNKYIATVNQTEEGKATRILQYCKKYGRYDFDFWWLLEFLGQPCYYCGTTADLRGLDRINNARLKDGKKDYRKSNILPCCKLCNRVRMDHITSYEMEKFIGPAIARVRQHRKSR